MILLHCSYVSSFLGVHAFGIPVNLLSLIRVCQCSVIFLAYALDSTVPYVLAKTQKMNRQDNREILIPFFCFSTKSDSYVKIGKIQPLFR